MVNDWSRHKIQYELKKRGHEVLIALDFKNNLPKGTVNNAMSVPQKEGEKVIANILKVDPQVIWPSRYGTDGRRLRPQPAANYKRRSRKGKSQKGCGK